MKSLPEIEEIRKLFIYDCESGNLFWAVRPGSNRFNGAFSNKLAGTLNQKGYLIVKINGSNFRVHRVIYAMQHGEWPLHDIDHIDGNKRNNRIQNLRDISRGMNIQNQRRAHKNNSAGLLGVGRSGGKYKAGIVVDGKRLWLGSFSDPLEAHAAYISAKRRLHAGNTI
jgi:HNH endonuclease